MESVNTYVGVINRWLRFLRHDDASTEKLERLKCIPRTTVMHGREVFSETIVVNLPLYQFSSRKNRSDGSEYFLGVFDSGGFHG